MTEKLYRVTFIRQDNGEEQEQYVLATNMLEIEQEYADIIKVEPLFHVAIYKRKPSLNYAMKPLHSKEDK